MFCRHGDAKIWGLVILIASFFLVSGVLGAICPNDCSGHGNCYDRTCTCFSGYRGGDCSLKECPSGPAWWDTAAGTDDAHNEAECSNRGYCDEITGVCYCEEGFEGRACERISCHDDCGGLGKCLSMRQYALTKDPGLGKVYTYTSQWDADMLYACKCDEGYFGPGCSQRDCPVGDDPLTGTASDPDGVQYNEVQTLHCNVSTDGSGGTFKLAFRQEYTEDISPDDELEDLEEKLQALSTVTLEGISVTGTHDTVCDTDEAKTYIEFTQDFDDLPLLVPYTADLAEPSGVHVTEYVKGTKENEYCSNRGICDHEAGTCTCADSFDMSDGEGSEGQRGDCGWYSTTITACPGEIECNNKGVCDDSPTYTCTCGEGWTGADCSIRSCPKGRSWFSFPTADNTAHQELVECSDMGYCDREEGICACSLVFGGGACDRLLCPGGDLPCNDHGRCLSMYEAAVEATVNGVQQDYTYGATPHDPATWDHDKVYGCLCDEGYTGYDCSLKTCPYGDDPITEDEANEVQTLTCTDADSDGTFTLTFRGQTTDSIGYAAAAEDVEEYLEALSTVWDVTVSSDESTVCTTTGNSFTVEFLVPTGDVPLLEATVDDLTLTVEETTTGTKEWAECSNRGVCDRSTGECACFEGMGTSDGQGSAGDRAKFWQLIGAVPWYGGSDLGYSYSLWLLGDVLPVIHGVVVLLPALQASGFSSSRLFLAASPSQQKVKKKKNVASRPMHVVTCF